MTKSTPTIPFREMDVHKARSKGGTEITARFFGQGPTLLHGDRSSEWFNNSVQHVAGHLPDATVRQIKNAAHFGPLTQPRAVAEEMIRFFAKKHAAVLSKPGN